MDETITEMATLAPETGLSIIEFILGALIGFASVSLVKFFTKAKEKGQAFVDTTNTDLDNQLLDLILDALSEALVAEPKVSKKAQKRVEEKVKAVADKADI